MARALIRQLITNRGAGGHVVLLESAMVRVLEHGGTAEVPIFATEAGGVALAQPIRSSETGDVEIWIEQSETIVDLEVSVDGTTVVAGAGTVVSFPPFVDPVPVPSPIGPPGASAYDVYVSEGGLLSREDWLASLSGLGGLGTAAEADMMTERGPLTLYASDSFGTAPFGTITGRTLDNELGGEGTVVWGAPAGTGTGSWRAVSLVSEAGSTGPPGRAMRNAGGSGTVYQGFDLGTADGRLEAQWGNTGANNWFLVARYDTATDSFYGLRLSSNAGTVEMVKRVGGVLTVFGTTHPVVSGDRVAIGCDGAAIELRVNNVVVESATDGSIPGGTLWGLRDTNTNATFSWNDLWVYTYPTVPVSGPVPDQDYVDDAIEAALGDIPAAPTSTLDDFADLSHDPVPVEDPGNPTVVGSTVTYGAVYWPSLVRLADHLDDEERDTLGVGEWGVYYSTDHDNDGGIALLTTDDLDAGPWTDHGQIYIDTTDGDSTETPAVLYVAGDPKPWWMYYQQRGVSTAVGPQSTLLVKSASPVFTAPERVGVVLDLPNLTEFLGSGHTGYFRPWRIGGMWYGYSLIGQPGGMARAALWASADGVAWTVHPALLGAAADLVAPTFKVSWNGSRVFRCRGQLWWLGRVTSAVGGGPTPGNVKDVAIAPVAPSFRHLIGPPRVVLTGDDEAGWVGADIRSLDGAVHDGRLHIVYGDGGDLGVAVTEVL